MAARKKRKTSKSKIKKKAPARRRAVKAARKAAPKKKVAVRAKAKVKAKAKAKKTTKRASKREYGEGNYKASQRFRKSEEAFVKANEARIPTMGKAAEDALAGPESDALRAAEAQAAGHAAGQG